VKTVSRQLDATRYERSLQVGRIQINTGRTLPRRPPRYFLHQEVGSWKISKTIKGRDYFSALGEQDEEDIGNGLISGLSGIQHARMGMVQICQLHREETGNHSPTTLVPYLL